MSDNAQLQRLEEESARLTFGLESLAEIAELMSTTRDLRATAGSLLRMILGTIASSRGALLVLDPETGTLRARASRGCSFGGGIDLQPDELELLREHSHPIVIAQAPSGLARFFERHAATLEPLRCKIWVSVTNRGALLGSLAVGERFGGGEYRDEDLTLLSLMASHAGSAIANQRLFGELEETNQALQRSVLELENLYDLGLSVSSLLDVESIVSEVLARSVGLLDAAAGAIYLDAGDDGHGSAGMLGARRLPSTIRRGEGTFGTALDTGEALLITDQESEPLADLGCSSLVFAPLRTGETVHGGVLLADKETRSGVGVFGAADLRLLSSFARQAAVAIENAKLHRESLEKQRLERDLEVAASIQRALLPRRVPEVGGFVLDARMYPSRHVGGDYYDFIPRSDGSLLVAIADVAGKSTPAALLVSSLSASLRAVAEQDMPLGAMVEKVNRALVQATTLDRFATFFGALLMPQTGQFVYVNAGHNYPFLLRRSGEVEPLSVGGMPLGIFDGASYEMECVQTEPGDLVMSFTDGLIEATNDESEEYGDDRVLTLLRTLHDRPLDQILDEFVESVRNWSGSLSLEDDLTLVVVRNTGSAGV